jgi:hypothetical protein
VLWIDREAERRAVDLDLCTVVHIARFGLTKGETEESNAGESEEAAGWMPKPKTKKTFAEAPFWICKNHLWTSIPKEIRPNQSKVKVNVIKWARKRMPRFPGSDRS